MKRSLAFGLMGLISIISTSQATTLSFWNEDIGPVRDGNFLRDQQFLVEGGASQKNPGSGLFIIPNGLNSESDSVPLFQLIPVVKCITTDAKILEFPSAEEIEKLQFKTHPFLRLPGEKVELTIPINTDQLLSLSVSLKAYGYGFTTTGGSVWTLNTMKPKSLSPMITVFKDEENSLPHNVIFSWPKSKTYKGEYNPNAGIDVRFKDYFEPKVQRSMLVSNWKIAIGLYCDRSQENFKNKDKCYMTRGLNRTYEGRDDAEDLLGLGEDFTFYAGHSLTASPYK